MKKSKEYIISSVLFVVALVLFIISMATGLMPDLKFAIDEICKYLGFAFFALGLVFFIKSKNSSNKED